MSFFASNPDERAQHTELALPPHRRTHRNLRSRLLIHTDIRDQRTDFSDFLIAFRGPFETSTPSDQVQQPLAAESPHKNWSLMHLQFFSCPAREEQDQRQAPSQSGASPADNIFISRSCSRKTACLSAHSGAATFDSRTLLITRSASRCWCPASFQSCNRAIDQRRRKIHRIINLSVPFECLRTSFHSPCPDHSSSRAHKVFICPRRPSHPDAQIPR